MATKIRKTHTRACKPGAGSNSSPGTVGDEQLAAAVELNSADWLRLEKELPWVEWRDDGDAIRVFAGDTWPRNSVALARFTQENAHRRVGEILERHLRERVACNWIVGPLSQPADLGKHLRAHGFRCMIHCAGMASELKTARWFPAPTGIEIQSVDQVPSLRPATTDRRRLRQEGRNIMVAIRPRRVWTFVASSKGRPVGETTLCAGSGEAGIYDVEVLEEFRGHGIGTALVSAALRMAGTELGFQHAVLAATGMGLGVYLRVGFREVCKLSFWKYGKMRQLR